MATATVVRESSLMEVYKSSSQSLATATAKAHAHPRVWLISPLISARATPGVDWLPDIEQFI